MAADAILTKDINRHITIVVCSASAIKLDAVQSALSGIKSMDAKVSCVKVGSGVAEQPVGAETLIGARNRVANAKKSNPGADVYIAIENGIFLEGGKWVDKAVVVCSTKDGRECVSYSKGVEFPKEAVEETRRRGFDKTTVGQVLKDQGRVKDDADPHFDLTGRKKHRAEFLQEAVSEALLAVLS
jgi:non-canonical (house-cleaning) NTP pyrophosphatase